MLNLILNSIHSVKSFDVHTHKSLYPIYLIIKTLWIKVDRKAGEKGVKKKGSGRAGF